MQLVVVSAVAAAVMAATMTFNSTSQRFFLFNMIIYYLTIYDFLDEPSEQSSIPIYLRLSYFIYRTPIIKKYFSRLHITRIINNFAN